MPVLVFLFGFSLHQAQGTTLALLVPPIGILAAFTYYKEGYVDLKIAAFVCLGFFFGGLLGARIATDLPNAILERIFGVALLLIALKMIFAYSGIRFARRSRHRVMISRRGFLNGKKE